MRLNSLRYFNVAGVLSTGEIGEDHDPVTHLIPIVLQAAFGQREVITIFDDNYNTSDGTCIRDYVHVEDLIEAHILSLEYLNTHSKSQIFNYTGYSVKEIVEASRKVTGKEIPAKIGERRAGYPVKLVAVSEKARSILGEQLAYETIDDIIQTAWKRHEDNPETYTQ